MGVVVDMATNVVTQAEKIQRFQELHRLIAAAENEEALWLANPRSRGGGRAHAIRVEAIRQWRDELRFYPREYHHAIAS